eukprot:764171-Hanusia_phi.AAC.6
MIQGESSCFQSSSLLAVSSRLVLPSPALISSSTSSHSSPFPSLHSQVEVDDSLLLLIVSWLSAGLARRGCTFASSRYSVCIGVGSGKPEKDEGTGDEGAGQGRADGRCVGNITDLFCLLGEGVPKAVPEGILLDLLAR